MKFFGIDFGRILSESLGLGGAGINTQIENAFIAMMNGDFESYSKNKPSWFTQGLDTVFNLMATMFSFIPGLNTADEDYATLDATIKAELANDGASEGKLHTAMGAGHEFDLNPVYLRALNGIDRAKDGWNRLSSITGMSAEKLGMNAAKYAYGDAQIEAVRQLFIAANGGVDPNLGDDTLQTIAKSNPAIYAFSTQVAEKVTGIGRNSAGKLEALGGENTIYAIARATRTENVEPDFDLAALNIDTSAINAVESYLNGKEKIAQTKAKTEVANVMAKQAGLFSAMTDEQKSNFLIAVADGDITTDELNKLANFDSSKLTGVTNSLSSNANDGIDHVFDNLADIEFAGDDLVVRYNGPVGSTQEFRVPSA